MLSSDIPYPTDKFKTDFHLLDLIRRIQPEKRASWKDIHKGAGVYIVYHTAPTSIKFNDHADLASSNITTSNNLIAKWNSIIQQCETDILYIGKGTVKSRVSALIRFGLGRAKNHSGGEWLWQVDNYNSLRLLISSCPEGKQAAYEKYLLDKFRSEHGDWPLANRTGGTGKDIWFPT